MELDFGLGLSNFSHKAPVLKELDLISYTNGDAKQVYDDHGDHDDDDDSTLSSQDSVNFDDDDGGFCTTKKRGFGDAFQVESSVSYVCRALPLLLWDKEPNQQERKAKRICEIYLFSQNYYEDAIVGWPPIKSHRKKLHHQEDAHHRNRRPGGKFAVVENGGGSGGSQSMFVKVQMEGCGITRKIDLRLYHSYESLMYSLLTMFGKGKDSVDGYKLTYQDREGDWLLAGNLPWRTFTGSVQRF